MRVELQDVTVGWGGKALLCHVNLTLEPGRMVGVVGPSGSGVSLLLKTAAGLVEPLEGQVCHDGVALNRLGEEASRRMQTRSGFMFQDAALWANTSLEGNLLLPLRAKFPELSAGEQQTRLKEGLQAAGFLTDLGRRPAQLSRGQQRFLSFLRATLPDPEALFLDEPVMGLDAAWSDTMWRRAAELRADGACILAGSHHFQSWCHAADHILLLEDGRIAREGPPDRIRSSAPEVKS